MVAVSLELLSLHWILMAHTDIGKINCSLLHLKETLQADERRQNVIRHMMTNIDQIRGNVNGEAINVDMPARINISCLD